MYPPSIRLSKVDSCNSIRLISATFISATSCRRLSLIRRVSRSCSNASSRGFSGETSLCKSRSFRLERRMSRPSSSVVSLCLAIRFSRSPQRFSSSSAYLFPRRQRAPLSLLRLCFSPAGRNSGRGRGHPARLRDRDRKAGRGAGQAMAAECRLAPGNSEVDQGARRWPPSRHAGRPCSRNF